jgi:uncharacterized surface protein with fasciclin (FAS1) repeats
MSGLVLLGGLLVACNTTSSSSNDTLTALEVIQQDARLSTLNSLLTPDISALLADEGLRFTFFAPANDAWSDATFAQLNVGRPKGQTLENVLYYHFAPGEYSIARMKDEAAQFEYAIIDTALEDIFFAYELEDGSFVVDPGLYIDNKLFLDSKFFDIKFVAEDIPVSNGIIHIIERVLLTPTISEYAYWSFVTAEEQQGDGYYRELDELGLFDDLIADGPFTAFLPEYVGVFEQLTKAQVDYLFEPANADLISKVIDNHIIDDVQLIGSDIGDDIQLIGSGISDGLEVTTRAGETYRFVLEYDPESDLEYWTLGGIDIYYDEFGLYSEVWRNGSTLFIDGMLLPDDIAAILDAL